MASFIFTLIGCVVVTFIGALGIMLFMEVMFEAQMEDSNNCWPLIILFYLIAIAIFYYAVKIMVCA